jgi:hypothetical protein
MRNCLPVTIGALAFACVALTGCNTLYFEVSKEPHETVQSHRKSYFMWALTPHQTIDMREKCPNGVAAIMEETNFVDGLLSTLTIGIYSPRTSTYYCLGGSRQ